MATQGSTQAQCPVSRAGLSQEPARYANLQISGNRVR